MGRRDKVSSLLNKYFEKDYSPFNAETNYTQILACIFREEVMPIALSQMIDIAIGSGSMKLPLLR